MYEVPKVWIKMKIVRLPTKVICLLWWRFSENQLHILDVISEEWISLVSLLNGISVFLSYSMPNPSFLQLGFELAHYDVTILHVNYKCMGTLHQKNGLRMSHRVFEQHSSGLHVYKIHYHTDMLIGSFNSLSFLYLDSLIYIKISEPSLSQHFCQGYFHFSQQYQCIHTISLSQAGCDNKSIFKLRF